jgi:hypothetical protein
VKFATVSSGTTLSSLCMWSPTLTSRKHRASASPSTRTASYLDSRRRTASYLTRLHDIVNQEHDLAAVPPRRCEQWHQHVGEVVEVVPVPSRVPPIANSTAGTSWVVTVHGSGADDDGPGSCVTVTFLMLPTLLCAYGRILQSRRPSEWLVGTTTVTDSAVCR